MSLYARADVMSVSISRAHGGCGQTHTRPVVQGAPVRVWQLSCSQCQGHLSGDPLWAGTQSEIPATYDEKRSRDNANVILGQNRDDIMAMALAKLAGLPVGDLLGTAATQTAERGVITCSNGHDNFANVKFCGECGKQLTAEKESELAEAVTEAVAAEAPDTSPASAKPFRPQRPGRDARPARVSPPPAAATTTAQPATLEQALLDVPRI